MKTTLPILACTLALAACADHGYRGPVASYHEPTPAEVQDAVRVANAQKAASMARDGYDPAAEAAAAEHHWRTDAECRYEAAQGSSNTYGLLMPAAVFGNLYQLCMRARS